MSDVFSPFSDPEADVILQSCDGVRFPIRRSKLEIISPVFAKLFSKIPMGKEDGKKPSMAKEDSLPLVENDKVPGSQTLDYIIRLSYFKQRHPPQTLDEIIDILGATHVYKIEPVLDALKDSLMKREFLDQEPLRVYAVACRFRWEKEAREAARATLRYSWLSMPCCEDMDLMTGGQLRRLEIYHRRCGEVAAALARHENFEWIDAGWSWFTTSKCDMHRTKEANYLIGGGRTVWVVATWWTQYMTLSSLTLRDRPCRESIQGVCFGLPICGCCEDVARELERFTEIFGDAVDKALSKIELEFI